MSLEQDMHWEEEAVKETWPEGQGKHEVASSGLERSE